MSPRVGRRGRLVGLALVAAGALAAGHLMLPADALGSARSFYLSCRGQDSRSGTSPATAWRTLSRANRAPLRPGERLLLRRGCQWNGQRLEARWAGTAAHPIRIGAFGPGRLPRPLLRNGPAENVLVTGSYLVISSLRVTHDPTRRTACGQPEGSYVGFEMTRGAHHVTLTRSLATAEMAGARLEASTHHIRVLRNVFARNGVLQPGRPLGAWGVLVDSDANEVAWNVFRANRSTCLMSNGRYASNSVELYGASRNRIHHNRSYGDRVFSELGSSSARTSRDNVYSYNLFVSRVASSRFITTRGPQDRSFGPVLGTRLVHNTTYETGPDAQGVVCSQGCSPAVLAMRANIIWADAKVLYADGPVAAATNLLWASSGQPFVQGSLPQGAGNRLVDPRLVAPARGRFAPAAGSPARNGDRAPNPFRADVFGTRLPRGGGSDLGAVEHPSG